MAARDLISLDELEIQIEGLDNRHRAAEGQITALQNTSKRVEKLRLLLRNPILAFVRQTRNMRRDYYKDLDLRVETDKEVVKICGVFGSQNVAPTCTLGTRR